MERRATSEAFALENDAPRSESSEVATGFRHVGKKVSAPDGNKRKCVHPAVLHQNWIKLYKIGKFATLVRNGEG